MEPIGITSSYSTLLRVIEEVGDSCYENILNELKNGKKYRLIGDNVNFRVDKKSFNVAMKSKVNTTTGLHRVLLFKIVNFLNTLMSLKDQLEVLI